MSYSPPNERSSWLEAERIKASHADAVTRLQARRDLSRDGQRRQLARLQKAARDKLAVIDAEDRQRLADRAARLETELFRPTDRSAAGTMSARDAASRCAGISNVAELQRMLTTAEQLGDTALAQAAARRGIDLTDDPISARGVWPLIHGWAAGVAGARESLDELGFIDDETSDTMARFQRNAQFSVPVPPELRGANASAIDRLAAQADADTDLRPPSSTEQAGQRMASFVHGEVE